jgi:CO/xanthine dehydrogenase FAD-binding subunit
MESFEYFSPKTMDNVHRLLSDQGGKILAGGTDLLVQMRSGKLLPERIIDISQVQELRYIYEDSECIHIGALTTWHELEINPTVQKYAPALVQAAHRVGAPMTRNRGTLGGNLGNSSPAADSLPPLLALDAEIVLSSSHGERKLSVANFLLGPGKNAAAKDEIIRDISFRKPRSSWGASYLKIGPRQAMIIAIASAAAFLSLNDNGTIDTVRIAVGAVAPTAIRCHRAETSTKGCQPGSAVWRQAGNVAAKEISPIDDIRASNIYRHKSVSILVQRTLASAFERSQSNNNEF